VAVTPTPAFSQSGLLGAVQFSTANTNRDGSTGTYSSSVAAGANGSLVDYIRFQAQTTTAAGLLRIFWSADNSTNWRLLAEVATSVVTVSGTVGGLSAVWTPDGGVPFNLPASGGLRFNTNLGETWCAFVHGSSL
jgi:hypothetical protein